jgi:Protein of unknown function (DUF1579)
MMHLTKENTMNPKPTTQHEWLKQLLGDWTVQATCKMPDGSTSITKAQETVRQIGELFVVAELTGQTPGSDQPLSSLLTLGFDPDKDKFVGSWIGSPMPQLITYEGTLSDDAKTLTLDCQAPGYEDPTETKSYQDVLVIKSTNEREFHSQIQNDDATWTRFMSSMYTRVNT